MRLFTALIVTVQLVCWNAPGLSQEGEVHTGDIDGVAFRIQIPGQWNNCLVMYAHGYKPRGVPWTPLPDVYCDVFLGRGFAVAESGYSRQGWAVEEGILETEKLRQYFVERYGAPDSTFITGHSMGGLIALATVESYPESYDGALPICGPLAPALVFFRDRVFNMLVTFEALFGDSLRAEYKPVIDAHGLPGEVIKRALDSYPDRAAEFAKRWQTRLEDVPGILSFYHSAYRELVDRAGGNPIDNRNTVYSEFPGVSNINEFVPRYAGTPEALSYVLDYYTPTGEIEDPVIAVHTTYDPGVPPHLPGHYGITTSIAGSDNLFVQHRVEADGHCNIDPPCTGRAFDQLRGWAAAGVRPEPLSLR